jgi:hypothetical protein
MKNTPKITLLLIAVSFWFLRARSEVVTFDFAGNVTSVYNPYAVVPASLIRLGDPVQISLRYDTAALDGYRDDPTRGSFVSPGWLKVNINGLRFECSTYAQIDIIHASATGGQELFQVMSYPPFSAWPTALPDYPNKGFGFGCWETRPPYDFLPSADLPLELNFSRADIRNGNIATGTQALNMYEVQFTFVQVPEPTVITLLSVGLLALVLTRRRHAAPDCCDTWEVTT